MRSVTATLLVLLTVVWPIPLGSQPGLGIVTGIVSLEGRPLAGATLALVNLESGSVHKVQSGAAGDYELKLAPGDYALSTEGPAGLAVGRGPIRVHVAADQSALADVDLVPLPVGQAPAEEPGAAAPNGTGSDAAAPPEPLETAPFEEQVPPADPASEVPPDPAAELGQETPPSGPPVVEVPAPEGGATIRFDKVECLVAGEYPLFNADILPTPNVARARVFFQSALSNEWFFVEMALTAEGPFQGKLPRPQVDASPITYYLQATTTAFVDSQSQEIQAIVVNDASECEDKFLAPFGAPGPVQVFSAQSGAAIAPVGFAAGGLVTAGVIAAVVGGAAAIGVGTVIITTPPTPTPPPPPPTPEPTPEPTPVPTPVPTPEPTPTPIPPPPPVSPFR